MNNENHEQIAATQSPVIGNAEPEVRSTRHPSRERSNSSCRICGYAFEAEWQTRLPKDGRKIGVIVHHVASMYPLEIQLASLARFGQPITGVTWDAGRCDQPGPRRKRTKT